MLQNKGSIKNTDTLLGLCLKNVRKLKKLTQKQLAEKINIPKSTYVGYENGLYRCPVTTLIKISEALNVPIGLMVDIVVSNNDEIIEASSIEELLDVVKAYEIQLEKEEKFKEKAIVLKDYDKVNPTGQQLIRNYANMIANDPMFSVG